MSLSILKFAEWQERHAAAERAREWRAHIGKHGRLSDILHISPAHCVAPRFTLAGQYTEGGKNYWESPKEFDQAMMAIILEDFATLADRAQQRLERDAATALIATEAQIAAIQVAIEDAKAIDAA